MEVVRIADPINDMLNDRVLDIIRRKTTEKSPEMIKISKWKLLKTESNYPKYLGLWYFDSKIIVPTITL